jgi:hypothetical protein
MDTSSHAIQTRRQQCRYASTSSAREQCDQADAPNELRDGTIQRPFALEFSVGPALGVARSSSFSCSDTRVIKYV